MSIYWERCSICHRHRPTKQCRLYPERDVCPYCCLMCPERKNCPEPAWFPEIRGITVKAGRREEESEAKKALEDLLRKLEGA